MRDHDCIAFLQRYLPYLGLRWPGYRKVRRTVCKRLARRLRALNLENLSDYGNLLLTDPMEQAHFDTLCRIPISRFYRGRKVFDLLGESYLPCLAQEAAERSAAEVRTWCAGSASGEEPYSLKLIWEVKVQRLYPALRLSIVATDVDPHMLERAKAASYRPGSLKDLPPPLKENGFESRDGSYCLRPEFKDGITFLCQDIRKEAPEGSFDLVLCRNLAFT